MFCFEVSDYHTEKILFVKERKKPTGGGLPWVGQFCC
jgi:hypothetical protein